jgi:hypothetical protein
MWTDTITSHRDLSVVLKTVRLIDGIGGGVGGGVMITCMYVQFQYASHEWVLSEAFDAGGP